MATATLHTVWDCRWSRPGHRITALPDTLQPETTWVCVRDGDRRALCDTECARCSQWAATAAATATYVLPHVPGAILTDHVAEAHPGPTVAELQNVAVRAVLVLLAVLFLAIGVTALTSPAAVVFTVTLWLCAAALLGLAAFGRFLPD
jgi:hypothetical protein